MLERRPGTLQRMVSGLAWAGLLVAVILTTLWILQRRLIYLPSQMVPDIASVLPGGEEVSFTTDDGLALNAWWVPPGSPGRGTILVFNGNAGNRAHRTPLAEPLARRGYGVLLMDYRGYGGNPGRPSEEGLEADARAAVTYLESRPDVDPDRLVYFGESLGAGVALGLADHRPPAAMVLRSPFTSLADVAAVHYPLVPASLLLRDHYPNLDRVGDLETPLLVIAGSADRIIPTRQSREVYEAASEPKQLVVIEGADHNDRELAAGPELIEAVTSFLDGNLARD